MIRAIILHHDDTVATLLDPVSENQTVNLSDGQTLMAEEDIPIYFKIALKDAAIGDQVVKYGHVIGTVTQDFSKGHMVHIDNIVSGRAKITDR